MTHGRGAALAWTPDGRELLVAEGPPIRAIKPAGGGRTILEHSDPDWSIDALAVHPTRDLVWYKVAASAKKPGASGAGVWLWQVPLGGGTPRKLRTMRYPQPTVPPIAERIAWLPDGRSAVIGLQPSHERAGIALIRCNLQGRTLNLPFGRDQGGWPASCTPSWRRSTGEVLWPEPATWSEHDEELPIRLSLGRPGQFRTVLTHPQGEGNRVTSCDLHPDQPWVAYATAGDGLIVHDYGRRRRLMRLDGFVGSFAWRP